MDDFFVEKLAEKGIIWSFFLASESAFFALKPKDLQKVLIFNLKNDIMKKTDYREKIHDNYEDSQRR